MAILTLSYSEKSNSAPTQSGWNSFDVDFGGTYTFTIADFTTGTTPEFVDPDGDDLYSVKIVTLPSNGTLMNNTTAVVAGEEILASVISSSLLTYVAVNNNSGYVDSSCTFLVSDDGSLGFNNTANELVFNVAGNDNSAPDAVGIITISLSNPESHPFTSENFTTETSPAYSDPEGDDAYAIKFTSIPLYGTFYLNGIQVSLNQSITIEDISNGLLVYNTDESQESATSENITFSISDEGSFEFTSGGILTLQVAAYSSSAPTINDETDVYVKLNEDYIFTRYSLITSAGYYDQDGDLAESVRFTVLPSQGQIKLNGISIIIGQEISLNDVDSGLLIYYTVDDTEANYEMNYQVKDSSGEWSD